MARSKTPSQVCSIFNFIQPKPGFKRVQSQLRSKKIISSTYFLFKCNQRRAPKKYKHPLDKCLNLLLRVILDTVFYVFYRLFQSFFTVLTITLITNKNRSSKNCSVLEDKKQADHQIVCLNYDTPNDDRFEVLTGRQRGQPMLWFQNL